MNNDREAKILAFDKNVIWGELNPAEKEQLREEAREAK